MDFVSVAVDGSGATHVAASDYAGIHYFTNVSGGWARADLTEAPPGGADIEPQIAVANAGVITIAFTRWSTWEYCVDVCEEPVDPVLDGAYLLTNEGTRWSPPELVLAEAQSPLIAYAGGQLNVVTRTAERLAWSVRSQAGWVAQPAGDVEAIAYSMAVDGNGVPHVIYRHVGGFELLQLSSDLPGISLAFADGAESPRLAFDGADQPHLVYQLYDSTADTTSLVHTFRTAEGSWTPIEYVGVPSASALAIDGGSHLHVTYMQFVEIGQEDELQRFEEASYASYDGSVTTTVQLDRSDSYEFGSFGTTTLALDPGGRPHIVFSANGRDFVNRGLWFALGPAISDGD